MLIIGLSKAIAAPQENYTVKRKPLKQEKKDAGGGIRWYKYEYNFGSFFRIINMRKRQSFQ